MVGGRRDRRLNGGGNVSGVMMWLYVGERIVCWKPLAYRESNNVHLLITRPPEICVNLVFKHIHAASSYTICRQFVPFVYCPL